jgi:hypothetical protein
MFSTKFKLLALVWISMAPTALAQQISIRAEDNRQPFVYQIQGQEIRLQGNKAEFQAKDTSASGFPLSISNNVEFFGFTQRNPMNSVCIFNSDGSALHQVEGLSISSGDESANVYLTNAGGLALRKNIAGFEFYDPTGKLIQTASNSSQSKLGEAISEYASDPFGTTQMVFNPRINFKESSGSRLRRFNGGRFEYVWDNLNRLLSVVEVSDSGRMVAAATTQEGSDDVVQVMDRYGNKIRSYETRDPVSKMSFSDDDRYLMIRSEHRVVVYDIVRDERVGSSSFRGYPLLFASYIPQDELIVGITGEWDSNTGIINNMEVRGVHLGKRSIASAEFRDGAVTRNAALPWHIKRLGRYRYEVSGTNRDLVIRGRY